MLFESFLKQINFSELGYSHFFSKSWKGKMSSEKIFFQPYSKNLQKKNTEISVVYSTNEESKQ